MRLKMQCLCIIGTTPECLLRRGVHLWEGGCLYAAGISTECPLRRGICLWEAKNAVFVCGWDHG